MGIHTGGQADGGLIVAAADGQDAGRYALHARDLARTGKGEDQQIPKMCGAVARARGQHEHHARVIAVVTGAHRYSGRRFGCWCLRR